MVRPGLRGIGRIKRRTPGGRVATRYVRNYGSAKCGRCGGNLAGTAEGGPAEVRALKHSERVPSRMYAGVLCADCVDSMVRYVTRMEAKFMDAELHDLGVERDLTLEKFLPAGWLGSVQNGALLWSREKQSFMMKDSKGKALKDKPALKEKPQAKVKAAKKGKEVKEKAGKTVKKAASKGKGRKK